MNDRPEPKTMREHSRKVFKSDRRARHDHAQKLCFIMLHINIANGSKVSNNAVFDKVYKKLLY